MVFGLGKKSSGLTEEQQVALKGAILEEVNNVRELNGLKPINTNGGKGQDSLNKCANENGKWLESTGGGKVVDGKTRLHKLDRTGKPGSISDRVPSKDRERFKKGGVAENAALAFLSEGQELDYKDIAERTVSSWVGSEGHNRNMAAKGITDVGIDVQLITKKDGTVAVASTLVVAGDRDKVGLKGLAKPDEAVLQQKDDILRGQARKQARSQQSDEKDSKPKAKKTSPRSADDKKPAKKQTDEKSQEKPKDGKRKKASRENTPHRLLMNLEKNVLENLRRSQSKHWSSS